jgi:hypothetical protein
MKNIPKEGKIDAIYLWVDSNKQNYKKNKEKILKKNKQNTYWSPTKDNEEIQSSIKSLRKNAPWIRTIYIFTQKGHKIKKIDEKNME